MSATDIVVITRTHNRPLHLLRCLHSVSLARPRGMTLVHMIVDNSEDNYVEQLIELIRTDDNIQQNVYFGHAPASKFNHVECINFALDRVEAKYVHILDDDDLVCSGFYSTMVNRLKDDGFGGVACDVFLRQEIVPDYTLSDVARGVVTPKSIVMYDEKEGPISRPLTVLNLAKGALFTNSNFMFPQSILQVIGDFDKSILCGEDYDFHLRVVERYPLSYVNQFLVTRTFRADRLKDNITTNNRGNLGMWNDIIADKYLRRYCQTGTGIGGVIAAVRSN